jgi:hypothetical protein
MSAPKMTFDWKRLGEEDKHRIIDSTRAQLDVAIANGTILDNLDQVEIVKLPRGEGPPPSGGARGGGRMDAPNGRGAGPLAGMTLLPPEVISADKIADYYPPLRSGAAMADRDGNLWLLPTTSAQSRRGELVYDVVNAKGELFQRVRVPLGRLIVGFGENGVVYMTSGDRNAGYILERTKLPAAR